MPAVIGDGIPVSKSEPADAATTEMPACDPLNDPAVAVRLCVPAVFRVKEALHVPLEKPHVVELACESDDVIVAVPA